MVFSQVVAKRSFASVLLYFPILCLFFFLRFLVERFFNLAIFLVRLVSSHFLTAGSPCHVCDVTDVMRISTLPQY